MGYNFLYEDAFDGSLLPLPTLHKAIWAYIVAKAKPHHGATGGGAVRLVPMLMAVYFPDASLERIKKVIECFCAPDAESRTDAYEGRKLLPMGRDLYAIPTYETHAGSRLARDAERKRRERDAKQDHYGHQPLLMNSLERERLLEVNGFIGSRLRVPKVLHAELRNKIGTNGEAKLQAWYLELDESAEDSGEAIPDIFEWLRPRFIEWCKASGLVKELPGRKKRQPFDLEKIQREIDEENSDRRARSRPR